MKRIFGIGIDIIDNNRILKIFENPVKQSLFLNKVLHLNEISEFNSLLNEKKKVTFLASRWAYKESLIKATGNRNIIFSETYLIKDETGKPFIKLEEKNGEIIRNLKISSLHVSLSHEESYSIATVIAETNQSN